MKVLIVDDSRAMRMIVKRTLGQTDLGPCDIVEAENGKDALEKLAAESPGLVLCDWNMPEMPGLAFLKEVRAKGINVPFGFITSESSEEVRSQAIAAGANFVLIKPFSAEFLNEALQPCIV